MRAAKVYQAGPRSVSMSSTSPAIRGSQVIAGRGVTPMPRGAHTDRLLRSARTACAFLLARQIAQAPRFLMAAVNRSYPLAVPISTASKDQRLDPSRYSFLPHRSRMTPPGTLLQSPMRSPWLACPAIRAVLVDQPQIGEASPFGEPHLRVHPCQQRQREVQPTARC